LTHGRPVFDIFLHEGSAMSFKGVAIFLGIFVLWVVLNRWILPWMGLPTCMSGGCSTDSCPSCGPVPWSDPPADNKSADNNPPDDKPAK
jgi:hypothetical protein